MEKSYTNDAHGALLLLTDNIKEKFYRHWIYPSKTCNEEWIALTFDYSRLGTYDVWKAYQINVSKKEIRKEDFPADLIEQYALSDLRIFYNRRIDNSPKHAQDYNIFKHVAISIG